MISEVIKELGDEFNYSALVYLVNKKNLDSERVRLELKDAIEKGYIKRFFEIRCCECGADCGRYERKDSIPQKLKCDLCGGLIDKSDKYFFQTNAEVVYTLTDEGKRFFRSPLRKIISVIFRA